MYILHTVIKLKKFHFSVLLNFFSLEFFCNFFNGFEISTKFYVFDTYIFVDKKI